MITLRTLLFVLLAVTTLHMAAQDYELTADGDTINRVDVNGLRQGPWLVRVGALRGQPGYEEEGVFRDGKKLGVWKRFSLDGDLLAVENFKEGFRDGKQVYFTRLGEPLREESWKVVDLTNPYDTIEVPDFNNPLLTRMKVVKLESNEVRDGVWTFFDPRTGAVVRKETYISGEKIGGLSTASPMPGAAGNSMQGQNPTEKTKPKPKAVEEWEKKNSGKKKVAVRDGSTGG